MAGLSGAFWKLVLRGWCQLTTFPETWCCPRWQLCGLGPMCGQAVLDPTWFGLHYVWTGCPGPTLKNEALLPPFNSNEPLLLVKKSDYLGSYKVVAINSKEV